MGAFDWFLSQLKMAWRTLSTFVMTKIICIPFIRRPFQRLDDPNYYGITNAINIRIPIEPGQELGAWFIRPHSDGLVGSTERWKSVTSRDGMSGGNAIKDSDGQNVTESSLQTCDKNESKLETSNFKDGPAVSTGCNMYLTEPDETVILYLHGNAETRSQGHRRELYKKLQAQGLVVMAVDYRGYGDSYGGFMFQTSESSMAWDGVMSFRFLKKYIHPSTKVIVWGHSLGTGVTTKLANELRGVNYRPDAYVLEAPFNSMISEVGTFLIAKGAKFLIDVDKLLEESDMTFNSESFIQDIKEPVFIMHAEDDNIIPFELGKELFQVALKHSCNAKFFPLGKNLHLGHDNIYKADSFNDIVREIVSTVNAHKKA